MVFEFEKEAMSNKKYKKSLDIVDLWAYYALRDLYKLYHDKAISRKEAKEEKEKIVRQWTTEKSKLEFLNRDSEALRKKIKIAASAYEEKPTLENAEKMFAAMYGRKERF